MAEEAIIKFLDEEEEGLVIFGSETGDWHFPNGRKLPQILTDLGSTWQKKSHYSCAGVEFVSIICRDSAKEKRIFYYTSPRTCIDDSASFDRFRAECNRSVKFAN